MSFLDGIRHRREEPLLEALGDGAIRSHPVEWLAPSRGAAWKLTGQESLLPAAPQPLALRTAGAVC